VASSGCIASGHDGERDMDGTNRTGAFEEGIVATSNNACAGACSGESRPNKD